MPKSENKSVSNRKSERDFISEPNVEFYLNRMSSYPNGAFIDTMHLKWKRNFVELESNHDYIQWLFPNSFQSRFNQKAKPLKESERVQFRENPQIAKRYVASYEMMLEFYGMSLNSKVTGQIVRLNVPNFKDRYDQTLLSAAHNHLRITRILCSLTEVGFSFYARELCLFLKSQIFGTNGKLRRLKHMEVYKHWQPFEGDPKKRSNKVNLEETPNIFLRKLWKKQNYNPLAKERSKWAEENSKKRTLLVDLCKSEYKLEHKPSNQQVKTKAENVTKQQAKLLETFRPERRRLQEEIEMNRFLRIQREREELQRRKEKKIQILLAQKKDNYAKQQMNRLRKDYEEKLKGFKIKKAETIEEREKRIMTVGTTILSSHTKQYEAYEAN